MRVDKAIGVIAIRRTEVRQFTDRQIKLVETFADQAVIAIENTRLFEAEQASKREVQESLEYQTATSEVLAVISRSPTNLQPVFDTIGQTAAKLCGAQLCNVSRWEAHSYRGHSPSRIARSARGQSETATDPTGAEQRRRSLNRQHDHCRGPRHRR